MKTEDVAIIAEMKLCRAMFAEMRQVIEQYGNVIPHQVMLHYNKLKEFYEGRNRSV